MLVNLKKAGALAAALLSCQVKMDHTFGVDIYGDPPAPNWQEGAEAMLAAQVDRALALTEAGFTIRRLIGEANKAVIDGLLAERALIEKKLSIINGLPKRANGTNMVALARQIMALREQEQKPYGQKPLTLEIKTEELIDGLAKPLKRSLRELDDKLQAANFNTNIDIPEGVAKVLRELDLI